jgi:hypothetical protein
MDAIPRADCGWNLMAAWFPDSLLIQQMVTGTGDNLVIFKSLSFLGLLVTAASITHPD